jgi:hypothetical protein
MPNVTMRTEITENQRSQISKGGAFDRSLKISVVDPDQDRVVSASFCQIRIEIGIKGMQIRIRRIRLGINETCQSTTLTRMINQCGQALL